MRTAASGYVATLAQASGFGVIWLVEMDLDETVYLCTAGFDVVWGGHTYAGAGDVGSIDAVADSAGERQALRFTLSSVPLDLLSMAMGGGPDANMTGTTSR